MKTEKRHQLQTNELSIQLAKFLENLRGKGNLILGIAIVALIAMGLLAYLSNKKGRDSTLAWSEYYKSLKSGNRDSLGSVAQAFPGSVAGQWALNAEGLVHMQEGTRLAFTDRAKSRDRFEKALVSFEKLVNQTNDALLRPRAMMGVAQAQEALGKLEESISTYRELSEKYPADVVGKSAAQQAERLSKPAAREWSDWFAKHEPQQSPLSASGLFDDLGNLPKDPNMTLPPAGELIKNLDFSPNTAPPSTSSEGTSSDLDLGNDNSVEQPATESPSTDEAATPPAPAEDIEPKSDVDTGDNKASEPANETEASSEKLE